MLVNKELKERRRRLRKHHLKSEFRGGVGGCSTNFYTGRLRPEVQPVTLLCTIFHEKVPLAYTFF